MSDPKTRILVIDDEPPIRRLLRTSLSATGFEVQTASSGLEGLAMLEAQKPEAIILDLGLPDVDGLELIHTLRATGDKTPIIVLSSRAQEPIKVEALNAGADDYVTKPFGMAELVARIRTAIRHGVQMQGAEPLFESGNRKVDLVRRHVTVAGKEVKLSPKEYNLLRLFVLHAGRVLTHHFILQEISGASADEGDVQYLRIYIRQLRGKIEMQPDQPQLIVTETGVGYRLRQQA